MIISEDGSFGKRMTWIPDPPKEFLIVDMGIGKNPILFTLPLPFDFSMNRFKDQS